MLKVCRQMDRQTDRQINRQIDKQIKDRQKKERFIEFEVASMRNVKRWIDRYILQQIN